MIYKAHQNSKLTSKEYKKTHSTRIHLNKVIALVSETGKSLLKTCAHSCFTSDSHSKVYLTWKQFLSSPAESGYKGDFSNVP